MSGPWVLWLDKLAQSTICSALPLTFVFALRSIGQQHRLLERAGLVLLLGACVLRLPVTRGLPAVGRGA